VCGLEGGLVDGLWAFVRIGGGRVSVKGLVGCVGVGLSVGVSGLLVRMFHSISGWTQSIDHQPAFQSIDPSPTPQHPPPRPPAPPKTTQRTTRQDCRNTLGKLTVAL
jgi:hypothetical protein